MTMGFDIIGDIHGFADELEALLAALGYQESNGAYRHDHGRRAVFLGDYIDRGPQVRRVLRIVRSMVEEGSALAILGNHEVNALRYHSLDAQGIPLRPHTPKYQAQHQATLDQVALSNPLEWENYLDWFARLSLWMDLGGLRVVHAAWDEVAMVRLRGIGPLADGTLERFSRKGTDDHAAISRLINGVEANLLGDRQVPVNGAPRREVRVRWWERTSHGNARSAIYPNDPLIPPLPLVPTEPCGYAPDAPPAFFGHYATTRQQAIVAPNLACLDLGIGKGGSLAAYRWDGESRLTENKLVMQPNS